MATGSSASIRPVALSARAREAATQATRRPHDDEAHRDLGSREGTTDTAREGIAAYRPGYLPEDRPDPEARLRDGRITGMATTTALEPGISVQGLARHLLPGGPAARRSCGSRRAGRAGRAATAVFIAFDDPQDTYLVRQPVALLHEPAALDPGNPVGPRLDVAVAGH